MKAPNLRGRRALALSTLPVILALLPMAGCIEINSPPERIYSTSLSHYRYSPTQISLFWSPYPWKSLGFTYEEKSDLLRPSPGDSVLDIYIHTSPDLGSSAGFFPHCDLRYQIIPRNTSTDSGTPLVSDLIRSRRSGNGGWQEADRRILFWDKGPDGYRGFSFTIPDSLLGPSPALAWSVHRRVGEKKYFLPESPGLAIRDEAGFRSLLYGTAPP